MQMAMASDLSSNAFSLRQLKLHKHQGGFCVEVPEEYEIAKHLEFIVSFTTDLIADSRAFYTPISNDSALHRSWYFKLRRALQVDPQSWQKCFDRHVFHPYVKLFVSVANRHHLYDFNWNCDWYAEEERSALRHACQSMLEDLKAELDSPSSRAWVKAHEDEVRRNIKEVTAYVQDLFNKYKRLLVIRVDFSFKKGERRAHDWNMAKAARAAITHYVKYKLARLLRTQRQRETNRKPAMRGYVFGTEYTRKTGWHFHGTLFLDGQNSSHGKSIGLQCLKQWRGEATAGTGRGNLSNLARFKTQAVGMVHVSDEVAVQTVINIATLYACKGDQVARALVPKHDRLMTKGRI